MGIFLLVTAHSDDKAGNSLAWWGPVPALGSGGRSEDAALERSRDGSERVHSSAEEALTFEKRSSSPAAIYPAFPELLVPILPVCRARRMHGWLSRGCSEAFTCLHPGEAPLPAAGLGREAELHPFLAGGPEGLQHPRGDGGLAESTAGLPGQMKLPLCIVSSPRCLLEPLLSTGTPAPVGTTPLQTPQHCR